MRLRLLPSEWPEHLKQAILSINGQELLVLSQLQKDLVIELDSAGKLRLDTFKKTSHWMTAENQARKKTHEAKLRFDEFAHWSLFDLAIDFYRLRNAGHLALKDISGDRLAHYRLLSQLMKPANVHAYSRQHPESLHAIHTAAHSLHTAAHSLHTAALADQFGELLKIMAAFQTGAPNDHFVLDLAKGEIKELK